MAENVTAPVDDQTLQQLIDQAKTLTQPPVQAPDPGQGGFSGFIGDVGNVLSGGNQGLLNLSPGEADAAGRRALLNFGINMLAASGKSYAPKDFGTVLAAGLQGAQQSRLQSEELAYNRLGQQQAFQKEQLDNLSKLLPLLQLQANIRRVGAVSSIPSSLGGGAATPGTYEGAIGGLEGSGKNPNSSAVGGGQFLEGTWMDFAAAHPELFPGMSRDQILAARSNPDLTNKAITWYAQQNAGALTKAGITPDGPSLALSHRLGPGDAVKVLQAPDDAPVKNFVSEAAVKANPELGTMTVGQLKQRFAAVPAPGFLTAAQKPPGGTTTAQAVPQVQVGKPSDTVAPPPPGEAPGPPISLGDALAGRVPGPVGNLGLVRKPGGAIVDTTSPGLGPKPTKTSAADAIVEGIKTAQATPPGGTLTSGPGGPTGAAALPAAPWPGTAGAGATSYSFGPTVTPPAAPTTAPPTPTATPPAARPAAPSTTPGARTDSGPPVFSYTPHTPPAGYLPDSGLTSDEQGTVNRAYAAYNSALRATQQIADPDKQAAARQQAEATLQGTLDKELGARTGRTQQYLDARKAWFDADYKQQQDTFNKGLDAYYTAQKDENTARIASRQKILDGIDADAKSAHDALTQLETVRELSNAAGPASLLPQEAKDWLTRLNLVSPEQISQWSAQSALDAASNRLITALRNGTGFQRTTNMDLGFLMQSGPGTSMTPEEFRDARLAFLMSAYRRTQQFNTEVASRVSNGMPIGDAMKEADAALGPIIRQPPSNADLEKQYGPSPNNYDKWIFDNIPSGEFYKGRDGNLHIAKTAGKQRPE